VTNQGFLQSEQISDAYFSITNSSSHSRSAFLRFKFQEFAAQPAAPTQLITSQRET